MQQVIIAIHLMVVIALVALVLYQKSEGSALGLGQSGLFSGRGQANALTRATGILGTIFFVTSILLTVLPAWERHAAGGEDWTTAVDSKNVQIKEIQPAPGAAPETKDKAAPEENDSVFEQLKRAQEKRQAAPQTPAATQQAPAAAPQAPETEKPPLRPSQEPKAAPKSEAEPATPQSPAEPKAEPAQPSAGTPQAPTTWAAPTK
ncbi:MAG TPA: preprotein translocase subunit SecG [Methylocystis sp.]|jgi:protein translocase SecG subunit